MTDQFNEQAERLLPCFTPNICAMIIDGFNYPCRHCIDRPAIAVALREAYHRGMNEVSKVHTE